MNDVAVIDRFLDTFSRYIDSGFGLLGGEVRFLSATLVAIDMTLAGLFWAMGHASGQGDEIMARLLRTVLYVGAFAYILGNFNRLAGIVFDSFAGLGLVASGSGLSREELLRPGRIAKAGIDAAQPLMVQIGDLMGFPEVFAHLDVVAVLFLAWLVLIVAFFVLAVQLFVTLIEFKLSTLAGFVLVPFALWNKTSFLAERVLGHVVSSGVKVLVLAVIVGIGSGLFAQFSVGADAEPSIDHALVLMLAALAMLGLGIFGPGIATGLVSGAPQLGAGAAAGTALAAGGLAVAGGAAVAGTGSAAVAGARLLPGAMRAASGMGSSAAHMTDMATGVSRPPRPSTSSGGAPASAGSGLAQAGMPAADSGGAHGPAVAGAPGRRNARPGAAGLAGATSDGPAAQSSTVDAAPTPAGADTARAGDIHMPPTAEPGWARRMRRRHQLGQAAGTAAHVLRSGDHAGGGASPSLRDPSNG